MADSWKERIGNLVRDRTKGSIGAIGLRHKSKETFISNLTKRDLEGFTELHCRLREGDPEGHLSFDCWKKGADGISRFAIVDYCLQHGGILPSILIHIEAQLLVSTVCRTAVLWHKHTVSDEFWTQYLSQHAQRPTFIGCGGLQGLYRNQVVYAASGLEGRLRHGQWNLRDRLAAPPTRGQCNRKVQPEVKEMTCYSVSLPAPIKVVRCSGDQVSALTVRGDLYAWRADPDPEQSPARALLVPGLPAGRVSLLSQFGCAATADSQLWCFCIDSNGTPIAHRLDGNSQLWQQMTTQQIVDFRAKPGICAAVTDEGLLYTWASDGTPKYLGRPGDRREPMQLAIEDSVVGVTLGEDCAAAMTAEGAVWVWGRGDYGQLGLGSRAFEQHIGLSQMGSSQGYVELEPTLMECLRGHKIVSIEASGVCSHFAALTDLGEVWLWGGGYSMQITHFHHPTCLVQLPKILELCSVDETTVARSQHDMHILHFPTQYRADDNQKHVMQEKSGGDVELLPWRPLLLDASSDPQLPQVGFGSFCWAAAGVYSGSSRMWRMALQGKVFDPPPQVEIGWQLAHTEVVREREHGQWSRGVLLANLRKQGLDVSDESLIEKIATKYAGDMFSDPHDPEYLSRVADHLVQFQIYGDTDFEAEDTTSHSLRTSNPYNDNDEDDIDSDQDILSLAAMHVSADSLRSASLSYFKETGFRM